LLEKWHTQRTTVVASVGHSAGLVHMHLSGVLELDGSVVRLSASNGPAGPHLLMFDMDKPVGFFFEDPYFHTELGGDREAVSKKVQNALIAAYPGGWSISINEPA
jgi:hypothetical protein